MLAGAGTKGIAEAIAMAGGNISVYGNEYRPTIQYRKFK
jgi:hypothetical protein